MSAAVEVNVLAVAEKVLAGSRGPFAVSVIEIRALALFVIQQQHKPKSEEEKDDASCDD